MKRSVSTASTITIGSEDSAPDEATSGPGAMRRLSSGGQRHASKRRQRIPTLPILIKFFKGIYNTAQCSEECTIVSLAYMERVIANGLYLTASNWRPLIMTSVLVASKVWDDLSMVNEDFSIFSPFELKRINGWEALFLSTLNYNVRVSASQYAKYYFELREDAARKGRPFILKPITPEEARRLEVASSETERMLKSGTLNGATAAAMGSLRRTKSDGNAMAEGMVVSSPRFVIS